MRTHRIRKKDEGSYALNEKQMLTYRYYNRVDSNNKEFYA